MRSDSLVLISYGCILNKWVYFPAPSVNVRLSPADRGFQGAVSQSALRPGKEPPGALSGRGAVEASWKAATRAGLDKADTTRGGVN